MAREEGKWYRAGKLNEPDAVPFNGGVSVRCFHDMRPGLDPRYQVCVKGCGRAEKTGDKNPA